MKLSEINIRDPFILLEGNTYYMFGTRATDWGVKTGGFDVYLSEDLENWSEPVECFNSAEEGLNDGANWSPEVWKYNGRFYMLATFLKKDGLRGTFSLVSENVMGPYRRCSQNSLTPEGWECLDGTLYIGKNNKPYLVFCHEHTQIIDGTICYIELKEDLSESVDEAKKLFAASEPYFMEKMEDDFHYVTDGPFMWRTKTGELLMLWSTYIVGSGYAECIAVSDNGEIDGNFQHIEPIYRKNGGHGMIFRANGKLYLTIHQPNSPIGAERPVLLEIKEADDGKSFAVAE